MDIITAFRARVEAALKRHDMAPTTFGSQALGDPSFVADLRDGERSFHLRTIDKVDKYIAKIDAGKRSAA